jgi:hypothetical protein
MAQEAAQSDYLKLPDGRWLQIRPGDDRAAIKSKLQAKYPQMFTKSQPSNAGDTAAKYKAMYGHDMPTMGAAAPTPIAQRGPNIQPTDRVEAVREKAQNVAGKAAPFAAAAVAAPVAVGLAAPAALGGLAAGALASTAAGVGGFVGAKAAGESTPAALVEGGKQALYEAGGRVAGSMLGRIGKQVIKDLPKSISRPITRTADKLADYAEGALKKTGRGESDALTRLAQKGPLSPKAVQYLTAAASSKEAAGDAYQAIVPTITDLSRAIEAAPKTERTVQGFLDLVNNAKTAMNDASNEAMSSIALYRTQPLEISRRLRALITPNMEHTAAGRAERDAINRAATEFESQWSFAALDAERVATRARLNAFRSKESVAQYTARRASRSLAIDDVIEKGLRDVIYPEMDVAAGRPAGYFADLKGRQSALITLESLLHKRIKALSGAQAVSEVAPRLSSENLSVSLHPGSAPRGGLYGLRNVIAPPREYKTASKYVEKAFPMPQSVGTMPYQVLLANLFRGYGTAQKMNDRPENGHSGGLN